MGQAPSSQNAQYKAYVQKPKHKRCATPAPRIISVNADLALLDSARTLQNPRNRPRNPRVLKRHEVSDSGRAYFCLFCDRSFSSNNYLQEHYAIHDPSYSRIHGTAGTGNTRSSGVRVSSQPSERETDPDSYCRVCNKPMAGERVVNHHLHAELHRNVRSRNELHQTTDRPELWCAMCKTRFTHTDRKRKHMEEMNVHNTRYRELQALALRDPNFDRSLLERPLPPAPQNVLNVTVVESESIHFCAPCDRYFSSAGDLEQHQSQGQCDAAEAGQRASSSLTSQGLLSSALPIATQSMSDLPLPPPSPPDKENLSAGLRAARSSANLRPPSAEHATLECALCLEHEEDLSALACGHIFGTDCIRDALKDDPRCPLCRKTAAITDLRRVFLS